MMDKSKFEGHTEPPWYWDMENGWLVADYPKDEMVGFIILAPDRDNAKIEVDPDSPDGILIAAAPDLAKQVDTLVELYADMKSKKTTWQNRAIKAEKRVEELEDVLFSLIVKIDQWYDDQGKKYGDESCVICIDDNISLELGKARQALEVQDD